MTRYPFRHERLDAWRIARESPSSTSFSDHDHDPHRDHESPRRQEAGSLKPFGVVVVVVVSWRERLR